MTSALGAGGWSRVFLPFALGYFLSYLLRTVNAVISPALSGELGDLPSHQLVDPRQPVPSLQP